MASLFKRGDSYYLLFYNSHQRPKRKQVPLKTRSKRTVEQLQRRMEGVSLKHRDAVVCIVWKGK